MKRGIHLKQLSDTDLTALGLQEDQQNGEGAGVLAEVDPALSRVVLEVRQGLEGTLELLEQALGSGKEG
jgi:hypothetical protein